MESSAKKGTPADLPNDIIEQGIVPWLSITELMQFRWSSLKWFQFISDIVFVRRLTENPLKIRVIGSRSITEIGREGSVSRLRFHPRVAEFLQQKNNLSESLEIIGSDMGVICVAELDTKFPDRISLVNPILGQVKSLPIDEVRFNCFSESVFGFGRSVHGFKVVKMVNLDDGVSVRARILTVNDPREWRDLQECGVPVLYRNAICLGNSLYWVSVENVYSVNLDTEVAMVIPIPPEILSARDDMLLGAWGSRLVGTGFSDEGIIDIYVRVDGVWVRHVLLRNILPQNQCFNWAKPVTGFRDEGLVVFCIGNGCLVGLSRECDDALFLADGEGDDALFQFVPSFVRLEEQCLAVV